MGEHGRLYTGLLKVFPPLGFMRYPIKFDLLTTFSVPLLAAFAVAWFRNSATARWPAAVRRTLSLAIPLLLVIGALVWHARVHPLTGEPWTTVGLNGLTRAIFLVLILALVLVYGRIRQPDQRILTGLLLLVLVWLDVATHAPRQNPTVAASVYQPGLLPRELKISPRPGDARAFLERQAHDMVYGWMLQDACKDYLGRRAALLGNCNLLDDIATPAGFYSLYVREQQDVFLALFNSATNNFPAGLADFLGIAYLSNPAKLSDWRFRPSYLPFCTIGQRPVFAEPSQTPALLLRPDFDPRQIVYLAPEARPFLSATNPAHGTVRTVRFTAQRMDFEVTADAAALLVLSQTYYHSWRAWVDDKPARLWRANHAFQALEVPAGPHRVKLVYEDRQFQLGALISLTTLAGCLISLCLRRRETVKP